MDGGKHLDTAVDAHADRDVGTDAFADEAAREHIDAGAELCGRDLTVAEDDRGTRGVDGESRLDCLGDGRSAVRGEQAGDVGLGFDDALHVHDVSLGRAGQRPELGVGHEVDVADGSVHISE
ncbi:hypothetical protein GM1_002_01450 [Gordonia malaquae NBRC 108250]|uniref:Uncharacterized protein n=1 Tax=Gordonia malaquae NBRC 108250 TaxID=1223542 RepID=M3USE7_GORML|nr:hypothetical protein GM1_002_01450 [Gordonia malaquae NBRC 108250]